MKKPMVGLAIVTMVLVVVAVVYAQIKAPQLQILPSKLIELPDIVRPGEQFTLDVGEDVESFWIQVVRGEENRISIVGPLGREGADRVDPSDDFIELGDVFVDPSDDFITIEGVPGESFSLHFKETSTRLQIWPNDSCILTIPHERVLFDNQFSIIVDDGGIGKELVPIAP